MYQGYECADVDVDLLHLLLERPVEEVLEDSHACIVYEKVDLQTPVLDLSNKPRHLFRRGEISRENRDRHVKALCSSAPNRFSFSAERPG